MKPMPFLVLAVLAAGCRPDAPAWLGTVDTLPNGTIVVSNPAKGMWDSSTAWLLTEEAAIGDQPIDTLPLLNDVSAIEVDTGERVFLLDRQLNALLMFDREGRLLKKVGREGAGPGEFRGAHGLGWDAAGRLWVIEGQGSRYSLFDHDGQFLENRMRNTGFYGWVWEGMFLASGEFMELVFQRADSYSKPMLARYDSVRGLVDTVPLPYTLEGDNYFKFEYKDGYSVVGIPYYPASWYSIDPRGYIWTGHNDQYELTQLSMQGDTIRIIRKEQPPVPIAQSERDSAIDRIREMAQGAPFDEGRIPRVKPALERVLVSDSGYIWVISTDQPAAGTRLDVFDPEGRFLGQVATPRKIGPYRAKTPMLLRRGKLWAVTVDEDDVPEVTRWRVGNPNH